MSTLTLHFHDGDRRPFTRGSVLVHVRRGNNNLVSQFVDKSFLEVKVADDEPGALVVVASRSQYRQCGFFVNVIDRPIHLMLVHNRENIDFQKNLLDALGERPYARLILSDPLARQRIGAMTAAGAKELACMMNALEALRWVPNSQAIINCLQAVELRPRSPQEQKDAVWRGLQDDRFFSVADASLHAEITRSAFSSNLVMRHPGAEVAFKETLGFGEANLNVNLDLNPKDQPGKILAEIDLDYFDDLAAHIALEVIPNTVSRLFGKRKRTNPSQIFALRWMATKNFTGSLTRDGEKLPNDPAKRPDFDPMFNISPG